MIPEKPSCKECGAELPPNAPQGLCPRCLAKMGLDVLPSLEQPNRDIQMERAGAMIGRYKLLEKIGEGGFGVVFMAEQVEPMQRKVALKIIKAGMDTKEVIARFEAERQAIALMDHPNIARVLDAGATEAGRPYFVMELVRGIPITEYCDQNHLPTHERLQLFIQVCQAVQHAHQKGVVHRDLKPSNVLISEHDGEAVPKVIDFGVAKALGQKLTEKTLFTAFHHMIGTPAYMSPEQAALSGLDIDTRADIYSLGVLLYELLTGVTPFGAESFRDAAIDKIRRMIQETEPQKPSTRLQNLGEKLADVAKQRQTEPGTLGRLIRGDLDWIVMRCLEKDRQRRYETANGLATDLTRHLANEAVAARAPSSFYRFQKFVRRNKLAFAVGAPMVTLILVVVIGAPLAALRLRKAHQIELTSQKQVEFRKKLTKAEALLVKLDFKEADRLMAETQPPLDPRDIKDGAALFRKLADFFATHGRWKEAMANVTKGLELEPEQLIDWISRAALLVANDDPEGYRTHCRAMVSRFGAIADPNYAQRTAKICLLLPVTGADLTASASLAQTALRSGPNTWRDYTMGLAEYRQGRFASAAKWTGQVLARPASATPTAYNLLYAQSCMVLSMSHYQSGQTNEARAALAKGVAMIKAELPTIESGDIGVFWVDWIITQALLREAQALIGGATANSKAPN
jgi:serine/threonine protein kinase